MSQAEAFLSSLDPAAEVLMRHAGEGHAVRIVTHNDADGVASGGILSRAVGRLGAPFRTTCEKRIDDKTVAAIADEGPPLVVFSDFGSGYLDVIKGRLREPEVIVLDHHLPIDVDMPNLTHVNPILQGMDGAREVSAAGVCYLLARRLDDGNLDMSPLGLVGALGDQQDKGEKRSLFGLNERIEEDALEGGLLEKNVDLIFYGYETRPIARALAYTTSPFIPGLSGREDRCTAFLNEAGIELKRDGRWRALRDLTGEEKRTLFSSLSNHMVSHGFGAESVHDLVGTIYTLKGEEPWTPMRDGREYASLLNACARMERPSLGLGICLGDRDAALKEAEETLGEYRRKIGAYLDWVAEKECVEDMGNIYVLRGHSAIDETIIGVVAGILLSQGVLKEMKPIVAWADSDEGLIKVSARATEEMGRGGLDLGEILREAAEAHGGRGGGHDVAAGAFLPAEGERDFLETVNRFVAGKLNE